jgi:hypothetical protein
MEIYNENVYDLLVANSPPLKLAEKPADNDTDDNEVFVKNLSELNVMKPSTILELMQKGEKNRTYGATEMNERSSRSHTIFRIIVESKASADGDDGAVKVRE